MAQKNKKVDPIILGVVFILLVFGLVMISSAGIAVSKDRFGDEYHLFRRQLFYGVIPGLIFLFIVQKIHYSFWKKIAVPLFALAILFLVLIFIPGFGVKLQGASRWLALGPLQFQPTEFMKLAIILYLALWIESKGKMIADFKEGLLPFIAILGVVGFLVIKQPDVGTLGAISVISLVMLFVSGAPIRFIFALFGSGIGLLMTLIAVAPYRLNRLKSFRDSTIDPQGIGYQINQALIAVGSGGIFGLGFGQSRQKFNYLPEPVGDSIYAIISEELGMIGAVSLLILFVLFAMRGLKIARNAPDKFAALVAVGISSWIIFQAFINIAAIIGLIPLTGIPLPFVSYGSTSLVFMLTAVGILLNISKYAKTE
ncbi:putative lipid II flippase FtsW [bacterium]|jgi:cell division protein FtsW|nr:putative lipid II flippase FtsW [bacterium]MBT4251512.1 putative lipid II flippase FtsW [bacterium]MBT4597486.1 putative lipid II flippase FtsW [bacterium]MBT6754325.1 putative lipid II flippase FtsW [bacterium]MBT7037651.1 putative lipid II flippase FtsW [bacterium]